MYRGFYEKYTLGKNNLKNKKKLYYNKSNSSIKTTILVSLLSSTALIKAIYKGYIICNWSTQVGMYRGFYYIYSLGKNDFKNTIK